MKRILIISGIVASVIALIVFNRLTSRKNSTDEFAIVKKGTFVIIVANSGELIAEKSTDIKGPEITRGSNQGHGPQGWGGDMHAQDLKIQDIVPEGTIVNTGDYIAQLDRTAYDNTLKTEVENLATQKTNLEMKILDSAVVLTGLRDDIKNQSFIVEEAVITLEQSKFEPPAVIRQAENNLDKARRALVQKKKSYTLRVAQILADIDHQSLHVSRSLRLVNGLQEFLGKFTITAPSYGMVIYKKEWTGTKRKAGSIINPFDRVVAILPDLSSMISKVFINEIEVSKIKIGQKVNIKVDAFPNKVYSGNVISIANVGEQLPNSDAKMFEVQIRVNGSDPVLRPSMTTGNEIIIKTFNDVVYIPSECVHTGPDNFTFVYTRHKTKQIVKLGESNEKNIIVEQGLEPGISVYVIPPENSENFKLAGEELLSAVK
jgi:HlyD family secretion protein